MNKVYPFKTREQKEIEELKREVQSLREELQSLSESLTDLFGQMYYTMEVLGVE